jgi:putative exosortase-associated protein (TIGR04073 family)
MFTAKPLIIALGFYSAVIVSNPALADNTPPPNYSANTVEKPQSYGSKVGDKALHGITNIATGFLEIPKDIINTTNAQGSNIFFGLAGGGVKGIVDALGRISSGAADLITAPLPTKPIAQPQYIWQDFDANTTYDSAFRLEENKQ